MGLYILKLTAILTIFWLIYVFVLEREQMHTFKRFYLITSILAAIIIPLLRLTEYVYVAPIDDSFEFSSYTLPLIQETIIEETPFFTLDRILWAIYIIGVVLFGLRFLKNLGTLFFTIRQNEKIKQWSFTYVLLKKAINPHTFFNYIFFNKSTFENKSLPKAVILHEETHAKQKHSIDVLFIELFQVVFWFHPLAYLYKKNIKLNHEFLADQAVLNKGIEATNYQNILLTFSSQNENYQLANAINYSSIKKRFTVIKTTTSKTKTWVTSLLVLPLLAVLFYSFSSRVIVEVEEVKEELSEYNIKPILPISDKKQKITLVVNNEDIYLNHQKVTLENFTTSFNKITEKWSKTDFTKYYLDLKVNNTSDTFIKKINSEFRKTNLSKQSKRENDYLISANNTVSLPYTTIYNNTPSPSEPLKHIGAMKKRKAIFKYNGQTITAKIALSLITKNKNIKLKTIYDDPKPPVVSLFNSKKTPYQEKATPEQIKDYNDWVRNLEADRKDAVKHKKYIAPIEDVILEKYKYIYSIMSAEQKKNAEPFPNIPPPPPPPPLPPVVKGNITTSQIKAYNKWSREINSKSIKNRIIKKHSVDYFKKVYEAMTPSQRENAEPFPKLPPPPPAKDKTSETKSSSNIAPPPPPMKKKSNDEPLVIEEVEEPIRKNNEKISKTVIEAYKKKHPESINKAEINGEIVEVVEVPSDQEGTTNIFGENYKYTIKDGVITYHDSKGKKYSEDDFKTHITNIEKQQKALKKPIKTKGGPNADPIEIVFIDKKPEKLIKEGSVDYKIRQLILRASKNQTQPLIYMLNNKVSDITSIENYLKNNQEANVNFKQGDKNTLYFYDKRSSKMSREALQKVYSQLFKTHTQPGNVVYAWKLSEAEKSKNCLQIPTSFSIQNNNTFKIKCIDEFSKNKFRVYNKWGALIYSKENYNNNWDGTVDKSFAVKGTNKIKAGTYYYVFDHSKLEKQMAGPLLINTKKSDAVEIKKVNSSKKGKGGPNPINQQASINYTKGINTKNSEIKGKSIKDILREVAMKERLKRLKNIYDYVPAEKSKVSKEQIAKSLKALNDYATTNTFEKVINLDSKEKLIMKTHLEIINEYAATNSL